MTTPTDADREKARSLARGVYYDKDLQAHHESRIALALAEKEEQARLDERERCARVAETLLLKRPGMSRPSECGHEIAAAIRKGEE